MAERNLVVISLDALSSEDYQIVKSLPVMGRLIRSGTVIRTLKGIYPTQTYPLHTTMVTGTYPDTHGIISNTTLDPGNEDPPWRQYGREIRVPTLWETASAHGLDTAAFFWPVTAGAGIRYNLPEFHPVNPRQNIVYHVLKNGSPLFILSLKRQFGKLISGMDRKGLDDFSTASAAWTIRTKKPSLVLIHLLDLDDTRHRKGFMNAEIERVLREQDARIGRIIDALEGAGSADSTNIVVIGDHGQKDVLKDIRINEAFRKAGLVLTDAKNRVTAWNAWANTCDGSAHVYITDPAAEAIVRRIAEDIEFEGRKAVRTVFGKEEIESFRLGKNGPDLILEAEDGFAFAPGINRDIVAEPNHRATHGYLPDTYFSLCMACGPDIRESREIDTADIIDIGPTFAHLLGLTLENAQGRIITEMLRTAVPGQGENQ